ncbi:hypothetical protein ABZ858_34915 [Streptomyces sp. NPDC047017]|uniref:hypothetical protein n=1 Tax=Streptomyces sp. NPDC047017 TaxID=3155024 RepID=UPI0033E31F79
MAEAVEAHVGHSHLFPGARVRVEHLSALRPCALRLCFSDGERAPAEILLSPSGEAVLAVEEYTTGAGTRLPARTWAVREYGPDDGDGDGGTEAVTLRLGGRLP